MLCLARASVIFALSNTKAAVLIISEDYRYRKLSDDEKALRGDANTARWL